MKFKKNLILFLLIAAAIVLGTIVANLTSGSSVLGWLSYGVSFGISGANPLVLDLYIMKLTFGLSLSVNISQIIFILLAVILYKPVSKAI